ALDLGVDVAARKWALQTREIARRDAQPGPLVNRKYPLLSQPVGRAHGVVSHARIVISALLVENEQARAQFSDGRLRFGLHACTNRRFVERTQPFVAHTDEL